jgi:signal transduction histidine kinase
MILRVGDRIKWKSRTSFGRPFYLKIIAVLLIISTLVYAEAVVRVSQHLRQVRDAKRETVMSALVATEATARSMQAFFQSTTRNIDADEFRLDFEQAKRNYPFLRRASFAYRIRASERVGFESEVEETGLVGYKVFSRAKGFGPRSPARTEGPLFPVVFSEPLEAFGSMEVGHDLNSSEIYSEVLSLAVAEDAVRATISFEYEPGHNGIGVVVPVYSGKGGLTDSRDRAEMNIGVFVFLVDPSLFGFGFDFRDESLSFESFNRGATVVLASFNPLRSPGRFAFWMREEEARFSHLGREYGIRVMGRATIGDLSYPIVIVALVLSSLLIWFLYLLERRRAELVHKNVLLEQKISELSEREMALENAKSRAEVANEAKTRFLGIISHEIRTPLNAIFGYMALLRSFEHIGEEGRTFLNQVERSGNHLLEVLDRILDFSRDQSVGVSLARREFDIRTLCSDCFELVSPRIDFTRVSIMMEVDTRCGGSLMGDPFRLKQVVLNLLTNSVKYTAAGQIKLIVLVTEETPEAQCLSIRVADTGCGMDAAFLAKAFDAFSQENDSMSRTHGGVGLGLSIVRNIVDAMKGTIAIESEKGKGTTVEVKVWFDLWVQKWREKEGALEE